jgi:Ca2+-binding RTX toxin-like protein
MPLIRIEWIPIQILGLGFFGFDHLQLVYQQSAADFRQDEWFVMEGVREEGAKGAYLGIEGADGRTSIAAANLAARKDLTAKIGTPEQRGSRLLSYGGNEFQAWESMASYAREIEEQDFPYVPLGLPGSPTPTVNSSSAIASLIHYSGLNPSLLLPLGVHLSPGFATLLGTANNDTMRIEHGFTTLLGGHGQDAFEGGFAPHRTDKFYGGTGDDLFRWSPGFNIIHGGQPGLNYMSDGADVVDYSGAGTITITLNRHWVPHKVPNYVVEFKNGTDHLFSVERIQWNETSDMIVLGKGVGLIEDGITLEPDLQQRTDGSDHLGSQHIASGRLIEPAGRAQIFRTIVGSRLPDGARHLELDAVAVNGQGNELPNRIVGDSTDNKLVGLAGGDTLYGGSGNDTLMGGHGSDGYVYLPGDGNDVIIDEGPGVDTDVLILAGGITPEQISFFRLPDAPDDLVLCISLGGRILLKDIFGAPGASIDRIVFNHARAWTREDLLRFAAMAPVLRTASSPDNSERAQTPESASRAHARTNSTFIDRGT